MKKILINYFNELIQFLSLPEISKADVCRIIVGNYGVYADHCKDKGEIIKDLFTYGKTTV
jgi:hypothetical protein